jgi:hypothetical protein
MNISFLEPARAELIEAVEYYNYEQTGLGDAFLIEIIRALERIRRYPDAWQPLSASTRRCKTRRFPYGIIYHQRESEILVVAVAHLHRKPFFWKNRL